MNLSELDRCAWYKSNGDVANYIYVYFGAPIVLILGLTGQSIALTAFLRQAKKESAYRYQIALSVSDILQILTRAFYVLAQIDLKRLSFFKSCYACMWVTSHFSVALGGMCITTSMLVTTAMAADRVLALGKPIVYKNLNHKLHCLMACLICALIGVSTSMFLCFRNYVSTTSLGFYTRGTDNVYFTSITYTFLSQFRNVLRALGPLFLIFCNIALIILYRNFTRKLTSMAGSDESKRRREQQKVLTILSIFDSISILISMSALNFIYMGPLLYTNFSNCESLLYSELQDIIVDLLGGINVWVILAVSKSFREMIFQSVPVLKRFSVSSTSTTAISNASGTTGKMYRGSMTK